LKYIEQNFATVFVRSYFWKTNKKLIAFEAKLSERTKINQLNINKKL